MPKAPDIDLDELSHEDLVGGEIKNVILNAARMALERDVQSIVTMQDFREAIAMEQAGQWNGERRERIGFGS
jgi:ATP-dependent 26S proteasome regulatory subunit